MEFERGELAEARRQIDSILHKLRAVIVTLEGRDPVRYRAQLTLARRRVRALELAVSLIEAELERDGPSGLSYKYAFGGEGVFDRSWFMGC